jgi:hypothetical protein
MTDLKNPMEVGMYREETGIVVGSGATTMEIEVDIPIAVNCHTKFRNHALASGYTLGVEDIEVTVGAHTGAHIAGNIASVSSIGKTITLDANTWDGETVTVRYYSAGNSYVYWRASIFDEDIWRAEHLDNIYRALNMKGNLNPTECGYVYDQVMAYRSMPIISNSEVTAVEKQEENVTGTWSFSNYQPYYVTSVRVEVDESAIQAAKGIRIYIYENGNAMLESGGVAGVVLNDQSGWYASEHDDTVDVWYQANIFLGMLLCDDLKVTVETNAGNTDLAAEDCHVFVSGWHIPDPTTDYEGIITSLNQNFASPSNIGLYRVEVQAADSDLKVSFPIQRIAVYVQDSMRTQPHFRNEFINGVEYAKNLTTDEFVTTAIVSMNDEDLHFSDAHVSVGDMIEVGYYSVTEEAADSCMADGDRVELGDIEGVVRGCRLLDRCDFGATNFPYGDGEFEWDTALFSHIALGGVDAEGLKITSNWRTLIYFDGLSYDSRQVTGMKFGSTRTSYNETPFFLTGVSILMDADAVSGAAHTYDRIVLRLTVNGAPASQYGQREVYYLPLCQATVYDKAPSPMGTSSDAVADGAGHMFYIPLGLVRCYGVKLDARIEGTDAFESVTYRIAWTSGWIPDDGA